jgi:8-oxo-dGTP pyrophosphatase MutT (NUDIX family)
VYNEIARFEGILPATIGVVSPEAQQGKANVMKHIPCVAIIIENKEGEILLLLRDNKSTTLYPNHWTLVGGNVEDGETPELAAHRELVEETGLNAALTFWKRYNREHTLFIVDQYIYLANVDASPGSLVLGEGQALQFFKSAEIGRLKIGYGFKALLNEYFLLHKTH